MELDISKDELELMSDTDLAYYFLRKEKKSMSTADIYKSVCKLLDYSKEQYVDGIGDFYTSLTIDKRFVLLENNEWDTREKHTIKLEIDDDDDDFFEEDLEEEEEIEEEELEDSDDEELDDDIDEYEELSIVDDDELDF